MSELAAKLGKSSSTVYRYERGLVDGLDLSEVQKLGEVLGVSPAYLMGWAGEDE